MSQHPQTLTIVLKVQSIFPENNNTKGCTPVTSPLPWHILSYYYFLLFFLMTAMASTSMLTTCMSFPVAVLVMRTLHIWIILKCFIDKSFYRFIRISGNSSEKLNAERILKHWGNGKLFCILLVSA